MVVSGTGKSMGIAPVSKVWTQCGHMCVTEKNPKALNKVTKCHTMIVQDSFLGSLLVLPVELWKRIVG